MIHIKCMLSLVTGMLLGALHILPVNIRSLYRGNPQIVAARYTTIAIIKGILK